MGVDHGGREVRGGEGDKASDFVMLQNFKHQITCIFLPLQQDFYSKSRHASPQNSSQIYAYARVGLRRVDYVKQPIQLTALHYEKNSCAGVE